MQAGKVRDTLLRQAFALYSEHFPTFFKIALIGYAPFTLLAILNVLDVVNGQRFDQTQLMTFAIGVFVTMVITLLFAYFFVSAATVPVVLQLTVAPLRAVQIKTALTALKRRWRVFALTSLLVLTLILLGSILFVIPGLIVAVVFGLYAPVAIMEQQGVRGTLLRSRILRSRRSWRRCFI